MTAGTAAPLELGGRRRPGRARTAVLAAAVVLVVGLVWLWFAWLSLILDYSRGYDDASYNPEMTRAELVAACSEPASEDYPELDWSHLQPPADAGRHVRAFLDGCVDAGEGRSYDPWRIWGGLP